MKRAIGLLTFLLFPALVLAGESRREDTLLTGSGTLFLVRAVSPAETGIDAPSQTVLVLTSFLDGKKRTTIVPGSLTGGTHSEPTLAWDESDERLYLFWMNRPSIATSELVITSWKDGVWTPDSRFGAGLWTFRLNLRLALTHRLERETLDGEIVEVDGLTVHAVWWNQEGSVEAAKHAMFTLDRGRIVAHPVNSLIDLVDGASESAIPSDFDRDALRVPFVLSSSSPAAVDVLFADWSTGNYYLISVTPRETRDGRLRIPLGVSGPAMGPPRFNRATEHLEVERRPGGGRSFIVYAVKEGLVEYVQYVDGRRGETRALALDGELTLERARRAVERLAESQSATTR